MFGLSRYEKRLKLVEEICERLERDAKKLVLEWDDTYDKFRQLHMRISKRVKDAERQQDEAAEEEAREPPNGMDLSSGQIHPGFLTARQKAIQQAILTQRKARQR